MKKEYPSYEKGSTNELENKLSKHNKEIFDKYLTFVSATAGDKKQTNRRQDILQIQDVIEKDFDKWVKEDIESLICLLKNSNRATWTEKGILITLVNFLRWQYKNWSEKFDDFNTIKKRQKQLKPDNSEKYNKDTMPTPEEIDLLIRTADKLPHKLWISMVGEAGLPYAVQSTLRWSNVEIDQPQDNITTLTYFREKNKHKFVFPLGKVTTYYLKQWQQEFIYPGIKKTDFIFPSPENREKPITSASIYSMLQRLSKKAKIEKHLYQYLIRHEVLSGSYSKMPEEIHRKLYGHKPGSKMTATYSHQDTDDTLKKALELLHKVKPLSKEEQSEVKKLKRELEDQKKQMREMQEKLETEMDERKKSDAVLDRFWLNPKFVNAMEKMLVKWKKEEKQQTA